MVLINEFIEQVKKNPENIAIATEEKRVTYKEIDEASSLISLHLLAHKLENGHAALIFDQCADMITAVLSALKAGVTYIPLSDNYPDLRMKYILEDAQAEIIITNNANFERAARIVKTMEKKIEIINMDEIAHSIPAVSDTSHNKTASNERAYILYTSGSTGKPKGVMQTQSNILHFAKQYAKRVQIASGTRMTLLSSFCHDAAVIDIFSGLLHGATLYPRDIHKELAFGKLSDWLIKEKINIWHSVPTLFRYFTSDLSGEETFCDLKYIVLGGENVLQQDIDRYRKFFKGAALVNLYGQSESSFNSSQIFTAKDEAIRIHLGDTIEDVQIFVVDENNEEVMPLCIGEIIIASPHVALGYWNKPQETSNVFEKDDEFGSLYWTGDMGRLEVDGTITWLGRKDNQLKIRGYRVELGDIESCIMELENIKNAAVIAKTKENGEYKLVAYYAADKPITKEEIDLYMRNRLPDYMMPNTLIELEAIPLTASNKVDRTALQKLEIEERREKISPRSFHENTIAQIWEEVLNIDEVYLYDDFFELGGNSLNIIQVANRITEALGVEISYADLMVYKTVLELSEHIKALDSYDSKQFKHAFKINKSTSKKNIFIIHGADGSIFYFRHLAKLLEDEYSVYGLQPSGLNGEQPFPGSYFEMIHDYVKEIRMIQGEGPYIVGGYCIGGYISYDIVNIFELQGDKVSKLIQLDEEAFITKRTHKSIFLYRSILNVIDAWRKLAKKDKMFTLERFRDIVPKVKPISRERQLEILKERESIKRYLGEELALGSFYANLGFIKSPTLVIKGEGNAHALFKEDLWRKMVRGELKYYVVPGDHETVMLPPYVEKFAEIIKLELSKDLEKATVS